MGRDGVGWGLGWGRMNGVWWDGFRLNAEGWGGEERGLVRHTRARAHTHARTRTHTP